MTERGWQGASERINAFFESGWFPAFALCLLCLYDLFLVSILLTPRTLTGLGAFAEEFRIWCFGYDPATGRVDGAKVLGLVGPPLLFAGMMVGLWKEPLVQAWADRRTIVSAALAAVAVVGISAGAFSQFSVTPNEGELPFPADALRTAYEPPRLQLVDQTRQRVDLAELRGKVVLLTAVYASCPHTCPAILTQAKGALAEIAPEERDDLRVVAVTLDPEKDSPEVLAELAGMHGLDPPLYHLVTGDPSEVEEILDRMGISRRRDPETGVIDHANLFLLLDREGKIAFRLGLGDRQERWLVTALRILLRESADDVG